jgi:hypothetical protein
VILNEIMVSVGTYAVRLDRSALEEAIARLERERDDPSIQSTFLRLDRLTWKDVDHHLNVRGALRIGLSEATNMVGATPTEGQQTEDASIEVDRLIRVFPADWDPEDENRNGCLIMMVLHYDRTGLILGSPVR